MLLGDRLAEATDRCDVESGHRGVHVLIASTLLGRSTPVLDMREIEVIHRPVGGHIDERLGGHLPGMAMVVRAA